MTQNDSVGKKVSAADSATGSCTDRKAFLQALYTGVPDDLYLELRCLHPTTGAVRTFWNRIGDKRALAAGFRGADDLNGQGYGVHFAPCLRRTQHGRAEAAALLPALWLDIDCDDDPARREAGLSRLRSFDPPPTAILDSGGGLHAYWFLTTPVLLPDDAARSRAAGLLRGLFEALGGDPGYAKSVASMMRLPGSINTKPERGGAVAHFLELHPERRAPYDVFAWLERQPERQMPMTAALPSSRGMGEHRLPERTQAYLARGAAPGSRNAELLAAACQFRDAGYSQTDAEQQLAPRHVADGSTEAEALATIRSAYSRPPRDPLLTPRDRVEHLVSQFGRRTEAQALPTAAQIAETVQACGDLNPLEWAEVRAQIKAVSGSGLKVADLDRMYREARRDRQRSAPRAEDAERYVERDGGMVYEKENERGVSRLTIADWTGRVLEWRAHVDDDGQVERQCRLQLVHPTYSTTIDAPDELFGDPNALARFIAGRAGGIFSPRAGMQKHLAPAILRLSAEAPRRQTYRFMGWTPIDDRWHYVTPELSVGAAGVLSSSPEVALEHRLRDYGLAEASWDEALKAFRATVEVFPRDLASVLIAFTLLPLVQRFFPSAAPKPALHLVGTTGSGKSEIAALMTSFYGRFSRDTPPAQWGDTVNTVETLGYTLADALYWVDDYKAVYADEKTFTRFLQSYSRGMGRGRLTREAKLRQERPCRGLLLSTGETTLEGEASILSRMLVLEVPPWEKRDPDGRRLAAADALRASLPAFTAALVQWLAARADAGALVEDLAGRFPLNAQVCASKLGAGRGRQASTGRMVSNWAVLLSVFQLVREFLEECDAGDALPLWQDAMAATVQAVRQERAGQVFLDLLGQLLAGGQCVIDDLRGPRDYAPGTTVIGYRDENAIYLLPDIALREISRTHPLRFTKLAIGSQLREDGLLIPGKDNLTVQRRVRSVPTRFWQLKADFLGCDDCDTVTG